jgi:hypothetical protein
MLDAMATAMAMAMEVLWENARLFLYGCIDVQFACQVHRSRNVDSG